ncbi:MAG TPA: Sir2 family NAD-dependent protein deacetylase [Anaeromyxobacteraceae bacterium]|nr:Sir2 family NAD-dependent protein deacetylase [Anaeromyxobacteraceae bacterium]
MELLEGYAAVAAALRSAAGLVVATGAGMGIDSGLPDFRGERGFWKAYPMYERLGISFVDAANPERFEEDPEFGWGFYGHRLGLYRATEPHRGYALLRRWIERFRLPWFAVTSNVDGQFQKAGFDESRLVEVHGSIHHLQCTAPCSDDIWENREEVEVDLGSMRARGLPRCRHCPRVARPNILMFGDGSWVPHRSHDQQRRFDAFLEERGERLLVLEIGAGTAVATIRWITERLGRGEGATVVRVNPREPDIRPPHLAMPVGALEALAGIDRELGGEG